MSVSSTQKVWGMGCGEKSTYYYGNVVVFMFYKAILLWGVGNKNLCFMPKLWQKWVKELLTY